MAEVKTTTQAAASTSSTPSTSAASTKQMPGMQFRRVFTQIGISPYNQVQWEKRTALIADAKGNTIFEQKDVEVPIDWSMTATNIVASKYLHGQVGTPE